MADPVTTTEAQRTHLLDPSIVFVDTLTNGLDEGPLQGSGLVALKAPIVGTTTDLLGGLNTGLTPLVGVDYAADHPNGLDPVDNLVGGTATTVKAAVGADIDALFGAGSTGTLLAPLGLQSDYLTDLLNADLESLGLASTVGDLLTKAESTLAPYNATLTDLETQVFALGGQLGAPGTELLASLANSDLPLLGEVTGALPSGDLLGSAIGALPAVPLGDVVASLLIPVSSTASSLFANIASGLPDDLTTALPV